MQESDHKLEQVNLFAQHHSLSQIYHKYLSSCTSQSERVEQIKRFINMKVVRIEPFDLIIEIAELLKDQGRQLSKYELLSYIKISQQIQKYHHHISLGSNSEEYEMKQSVNQSQQLVIGICLDTIKMIYFDSKKSWIRTSQIPQMKFQFKCLLFDLLNEALQFIRTTPSDERRQMKLVEFTELLRYHNLIDNLLTNNMHLQILKKAQYIFAFSLQLNVNDEMRFFKLMKNYLNKSIEEKRVAQQILQITIRSMNSKTLLKCITFIVSQVLSMQPNLIEDSTVSCLGTFVKTIIRCKQDLIKNYDDEKKVYGMVQKMKELTDKINENVEMKRRLNQLYYDCVNRIFIDPQIKKNILKQFHESLTKILAYLESYCINTQKLTKDKSKAMDFDDISNSLIQIIDNLIGFIASYQFEGLKEKRKENKHSSISQISRYLFEECIINELIFHALHLIHDFTSKKTLNDHEISRKTNNGQQISTSISKLLQLLKYIIISGSLQQSQVKEQIQRVFTIIEGSMEFLKWVMGFSDALQDQIFTSIFNNPTFGFNFSKISFEGFIKLFRKFLELNYQNNNFLAVYYKKQEGISFKMKKSSNFVSNMVLEGRLIEVSDEKLMDCDEILEVIGIKVVMCDWLGMGFMVMLGWYTESIEIKEKILSLLVQSRHLKRSTINLVTQSQQEFIRVSIERLASRMDKLKQIKQVNLEPNTTNYHKKAKYIAQMKGVITSLRLFIQQILPYCKDHDNNSLTLSGLMSINSVEVDFAVYQGWSCMNVEELYRIGKQANHDSPYDLNAIMKRLFGLSSTSTKKWYKVRANAESFIKDCMYLLNKEAQSANKQQHTDNFPEYHPLNLNKYLCFEIKKTNTTRQQQIPVTQSPVDLWTRLSQQDVSPQFCLIDKSLYQLFQVTFTSSTQSKSSVQSVTQCDYIAERLISLVRSTGVSWRQVIQQVAYYWSSLQHYELIRVYLQQLTQLISNNSNNNTSQSSSQIQQLDRYSLSYLLHTQLYGSQLSSNSTSQSDRLLYATFLIHFEQIIIMLLFQHNEQKYNNGNDQYQESVNTVKSSIERKQHYQLLLDVASLTQEQLHCITQSAQQSNKQYSLSQLTFGSFNKLDTQISKLLNVLAPCRQWMGQSIDKNFECIIKTNNLKLKQYLLKITLHKLIQSHTQQRIAWKQKHRGAIITKLLEQLVLNTNKVRHSVNTYIAIDLLLQHIIVDISSQRQLKEFNPLLQNAFQVGFYSLNSDAKQMEYPAQYTNWIVNEVLPLKLVILLSDTLLNDRIIKQKLTKPITVLLYQYLHLSSNQKQLPQLLIFILQKVVLNNQADILLKNEVDIHYQMEKSSFSCTTSIRDGMRAEECENQLVQSDYLFRQDRRSSLHTNNYEQLFVYCIGEVELVDQQSLQHLITHLIDKVNHACVISPQGYNYSKINLQLFSSSSILLKVVIQYCQRYQTATNINQYEESCRNEVTNINTHMHLNYRLNFVSKVLSRLFQLLKVLPLQPWWYANQQRRYDDGVRLVQLNTIKTILLICKSFACQNMFQRGIEWKLLLNRLFPFNNPNQYSKLFIHPQVRVQTFNLLSYLASISPSINQYLITDYLPIVNNQIKIISFPQASNKVLFKKVKVGLYNYGNTCYINSLVQLLFSITSLSDELIQHYREDNDELSLTILQLKHLFTVMKYSNAQFYAPYQFISSLQSHINLTHQQDTTQFFHILYNQLQKSHIEKILKPLQGTTKTTIVCQNCHKQKINEQPFLLYNVEIKDISTLQTALTIMSREQIVDDYKCPQCEHITRVVKHTNIYQTPQYLFLQLKRINYDYNLDRSVKIHSRLEFPQVLKLRDITNHVGQQLRDDASFELFGIIVHVGSGEQGHYYSYVRESDGRWVCCNDTIINMYQSNATFIEKCYGGITGNTTDNVQWSQNAYILVYRKTGGNNISIKQSHQTTINQLQMQRINLNQSKKYQNPLINSIREENRCRIIDFLLEQLEAGSRRNIFANFAHQLFMMNGNEGENVMATLDLCMDFSLTLMQAHIQGIEFFLFQTKSLLAAHLHLLAADNLFKWFPQDMVLIENALLVQNPNEQEIKTTFLMDVFLMILKQVIFDKNRHKVPSSSSSLLKTNGKNGLQMTPHNERKKTSLNLSQELVSYLQSIFTLIPAYLLGMQTANPQIQLVTKLYNLIRLCNSVIEFTSDSMKKTQICKVIFGKMSFREFLIQYLQIESRTDFNKVDKEIFKLIAKIMTPLVNKTNEYNSLREEINTRRMLKVENTMKLQEQQKEAHIMLSQEKMFQDDNKLMVVDKPHELKPILVSNQFWYKVTALIQNQSLQSEKEHEKDVFAMLLPVFNFGLKNSFDLAIKLGKYLESKLPKSIEKIGDENKTILQLIKWMDLLRILVTHQTNDKIMVNLQHFVFDSEYKSIEYEWNSLLRVKVQNDEAEHLLVMYLQDLEKQLIRIGGKVLKRGRNEMMETEEDLSFQNKKGVGQSKQSQVHEGINCFVGYELHNYLKCMSNYLHLIIDVAHLLRKEKSLDNRKSSNNCLSANQQGYLSMYFLRKCNTLSKISQTLQQNNGGFLQFTGELVHNLRQMERKLSDNISTFNEIIVSKLKQTVEKVSDIEQLIIQMHAVFDEYAQIFQKSGSLSYEANRRKNQKNNQLQTTSELQIENSTSMEASSYEQHRNAIISTWQKDHELDDELKGVACSLKLIKPLSSPSYYLNKGNGKNFEMIEVEIDQQSQTMEMMDDSNTRKEINKIGQQNQCKMILQLSLDELLVYKIQHYQLLVQLTYYCLYISNNSPSSLSPLTRQNNLQYQDHQKKYLIFTLENISEIQSTQQNTLNADDGPLTVSYLQQQARVVIRLSIAKVVLPSTKIIKVVPTNVMLLQKQNFNS